MIPDYSAWEEKATSEFDKLEAIAEKVIKEMKKDLDMEKSKSFGLGNGMNNLYTVSPSDKPKTKYGHYPYASGFPRMGVGAVVNGKLDLEAISKNLMVKEIESAENSIRQALSSAAIKAKIPTHVLHTLVSSLEQLYVSKVAIEDANSDRTSRDAAHGIGVGRPHSYLY